MKVYEAVIILKPDYDEKDKQEILNFCKNHMENMKCEERGMKKLACKIEGYENGYFIQFEFTKNEKKITRYFSEKENSNGVKN